MQPTICYICQYNIQTILCIVILKILFLSTPRYYKMSTHNPGWKVNCAGRLLSISGSSMLIMVRSETVLMSPPYKKQR